MPFNDILLAIGQTGLPILAAAVVLYLFVRSEMQELPVLQELVHEVKELRNDVRDAIQRLYPRR